MRSVQAYDANRPGGSLSVLVILHRPPEERHVSCLLPVGHVQVVTRAGLVQAEAEAPFNSDLLVLKWTLVDQ